jgi:phospholipase/carboxylesterase
VRLHLKGSMRTNIAGFECIVENAGQSNCVVLFHGFGADFSDLVSLADLLDPDGAWTWIFPNGPSTVDIGAHMTGRAWFPISIADLEASMTSGAAKDYAPIQVKPPVELLNELKVFIEDLKKEYEGIVLGGFSQGGMMATHLFGEAGDSLRGALLLSTVLLNQALLEKSLTDVKPKPFFQSHGSRDVVLHIKFAQSLYQFLKQKGWKGTWVDFAGGHEIPMAVLIKAREFLKALES